jgi:arylsulfatase
VSHAEAETRPNILLVMTDQQRADALGSAGGSVDTPHLDSIAAEGVRFANAYTNSPVCIPARVSLATGRYPHNHGVWANQRYTLPPRPRTWMAEIRRAGYRTSLFGKTHLHPQSGDLRDRLHLLHAYGLDDVDEIAGPHASLVSDSNMTDEWKRRGVYADFVRDMRTRKKQTPAARPSPLPLDCYPDVYVGQAAAGYLRAYDRAEPWFCWVSFGGPHEPWDAPVPYADRYSPESMPRPVQPVVESWDRDRPTGVLDRRMLKRPDLDEADVAALRANYAGNVTLIDDQVGELLGAVAARGELDRTVVAVVSDHGEMNGDYGLLYKNVFLGGASRIPFLIRTPQTAARPSTARVRDQPVELMDLGPTLVDLAGGRTRVDSHARSLAPVLESPTAVHRSEALSEIHGEVMIATTDWKLALNAKGEPYVLFDLGSDPSETTNLVGLPEHADVQRDLERRLLRRIVSSLR